MRKILIVIFSVIMAAFAASTLAGDQHKVQGVIKAVKAAEKKLTVSHGPIASLGMSGMTMDFPVYDPAMLDEVAEGHKISMMVERDKEGRLVIMELEDQGMADGSMSGHESMHMNEHGQ